MVPGGRERTQQEDELQHQVEDDSAQGPVVRARGLHRHPAWTNGTVIWKQDMPNTAVGVRSVWLAKERARLIDGWKRRATMGIQSFVWTMLFGSMVREAGCSLIPCRARAHTTSMDCWQARERCDHEPRADHGDQMRSRSVDLGRGECYHERVEEH